MWLSNINSFFFYLKRQDNNKVIYDVSSLLNTKVLNNLRSIVAALQCNHCQTYGHIQQIAVTSLNSSNVVMTIPPNTVQSNKQQL